MSRTLGPLLDPASPDAIAITIGRKAFILEMLMSALLSLSLPMISLAGIYFYLYSSNVAPIGIIVGVITMSALTSIPLIFYASLRLNAAVLARERIYRATNLVIHKPMEGPLLLRHFPVAGSLKSRSLAAFPGFLGFGLEFVFLFYLTGGSGFIISQIPIGAALVIQTIVAANLLR